jgi:four helix bundle protein
MGRLSAELRLRAEVFGDRMLDVVQALERKRVYGRVIDQMVGCGTSVGANACESDQAVSAKDFCKALGIAIKELSEAAYWLRTCSRRGWLKPARLVPLEQEATELGRVFSSMVVRTKRSRLRPR